MRRFANAEAAIVNRRIELADELKTIWAAWRHIGSGVMNEYARLLAGCGGARA